MVGFPKVIKTKADLVNTYKLVKKGRLKKEDWLAAVEKLENQNFIFCPILEKTEDRNNQTKHTILTLSKAIAADTATIGIPAEVTFYDRLGITEEEVEQMKGELA